MNQPSDFKSPIIKPEEEASLLGYLNKLPQKPPKFKPIQVIPQPPIEVETYDNPFRQNQHRFDPSADITLPLCKDDLSSQEEEEEEEEEETFHTAVDEHSKSQFSVNPPNHQSCISFSPQLEDEIEDFRRIHISPAPKQQSPNSKTIKSSFYFPMTSTPPKKLRKFTTSTRLSTTGIERAKNLLNQFNNTTRYGAQLPDLDQLTPISSPSRAVGNISSPRTNYASTPTKIRPERVKRLMGKKGSPYAKPNSSPHSNHSSPSEYNDDSFFSASSNSDEEPSPTKSPRNFTIFPTNSRPGRIKMDSPSTKTNSSPKSSHSNSPENSERFLLDFGSDEELSLINSSAKFTSTPIKSRTDMVKMDSPSKKANLTPLPPDSNSPEDDDFTLDLSFIPNEKRVQFHLNEESQLDFDQRPENIHDVDIPLIFDALQQFPPNTFDNGRRLRPADRPKFNYPFTKKDFDFDVPLSPECFTLSPQKAFPKFSTKAQKDLYKKFMKDKRSQTRAYMRSLSRRIE